MSIPPATGSLPLPRWAYVPDESEANHKALVPSRFRDFVPARLLGEALAELRALRARKAIARGDGFVDGFPTAALAGLLEAKLAQPSLSKADWIEIAAVGRI